MRRQTMILIAAILVLALLALGGTTGAMALAHNGWGGNPGYGYNMMNGQQGYPGMMNGQQGYPGMMNGQQGYPGMMNGQQGYPGMMNGQQGYPGMMGGYQQNTAQQSAPLTGVAKMNIQNMAFMAPNIQVKVGTTVTWTNQDNVPHSVTFRNGMKDSGLLSQGQSFSYTFHTPGVYQYYCTVHPSMVATVTVVS